MGCAVMWPMYLGLECQLSLKEFLWFYTPIRSTQVDRFWYFRPRNQGVSPITSYPDTNKGWHDRYFFMSGVGWERFPGEDRQSESSLCWAFGSVPDQYRRDIKGLTPLEQAHVDAILEVGSIDWNALVVGKMRVVRLSRDWEPRFSEVVFKCDWEPEVLGTRLSLRLGTEVLQGRLNVGGLGTLVRPATGNEFPKLGNLIFLPLGPPSVQKSTAVGSVEWVVKTSYHEQKVPTGVHPNPATLFLNGAAMHQPYPWTQKIAETWNVFPRNDD
ncbi:hypothetical protein CJ030_MR0G003691 [Morella rubra]|uniref:Uncharacterized protein n=1 Tax=Morella rubra TaxID=262757 RepID=A0A6A1UMN0_9ROSI|nr:hypothetical protein CJ030_MR0G003691 [Morella rubra]